VAHDLLSVLRARDRDAPRFEVELRVSPLHLDAQVHRPGPVLLDLAQGQPVAPYGLDPKFAELFKDRDALLRTLGIEPNGPDRVQRLAELEQRTVLEREARACGLPAVTSGPMRGWLKLLPPEPNGRRYALILGGYGLAVQPATHEHARLEGRRVELDLSQPQRGPAVRREFGLEWELKR
jgi:hypothetical protein